VAFATLARSRRTPFSSQAKLTDDGTRRVISAVRTTGPALRGSAKWFAELDAAAAAKVTTAVRRMELGNFSNVKGVGAGVLEYRIDLRLGYRIYFGKDGDVLVILLGGGKKKVQQHDIATAHERWKNYTQRKSREK
jgi:putative addiction module killer protein